MDKIPMTKKLEQYFARIQDLERQLARQADSEALARKELELRFTQIVTAQREEIATLRKELARECKNRRRRNARALAKFKSE